MDRIYFAENPWPNGHRIASFEWSAHFEIGNLAKPGLYFDFHLETADYDEEDLNVDNEEDEEEAKDEWHAKIVWNNYHSCTLSSTQWGDTGFLAGTDLKPFDLESLDGKEYRIDFLTPDEQENLDQDTTSFGIYLLGHDAAAFHTIKFTKTENQTFNIDWNGKLAHAYVGDHEFKHDFHTLIHSAEFRGIVIDDETTNEQAFELLKQFVCKPQLFRLVNVNGGRRFVLNNG